MAKELPPGMVKRGASALLIEAQSFLSRSA